MSTLLITMTLKAVNQRISVFEEKLKAFQTRLEGATAAGANTTTNLNSVKVETLASEFETFRLEVITELGDLKKDLQDQIRKQEFRIDEAEQYSRRNCLLLHGVSETPNEDVYTKVTEVLKDKLNLELTMMSFDRCHRLGKPKRSTADVVATGRRPIIIKFTRYHERERVWRAKRLLKGTAFLITESLTATRKEMLNKARDHFGARKTYTLDGRIIIVDPEGKKTYVNTPAELDCIMKGLGSRNVN